MQKVRRQTTKQLPKCLCGHSWNDHHHGFVLNPAYADDPLTHKGIRAQECEATQTNGEWHSDDPKKHCYCDSYVPNDWQLVRRAYRFHLTRERERLCQKQP